MTLFCLKFQLLINSLTETQQAEERADLAERTMAKLQKEVDRLEGIYLVFNSNKQK